ncbi:hypothetical protein [Muricoccus vinaceus]|uniref:Uncharacterized protein n=1 Tax=Muricoccus vinaceus TaxID=424704 RepID=A0ABV6INS6_9PROT
MTPLTPEELRRAVRKVVADYEAFVARGPAADAEEDPKAFAARHAAARSALAHLEHLMKLAPGGEGESVAGEAGALIAQARQSIRVDEQVDREGEGGMEDDDQC